MEVNIKVKRHLISWALAVPLLLTFVIRRPEDRHHITFLDNQAVTYANYIGDASFALTGALTAGTEGMDLLGCIMVGFITALGGGTVRDIALGRFPLFWATACDESGLCIIVASVAFFLWPRLSHAFNLSTTDEWLFWTDTLGLGVFAALGANTACGIEPRINFGACAASGMFTATFGGLTRDILCQKPPRILYSAREMYALPALMGGIASTAILRWAGATMIWEAVLFGTWVTMEMRVIAINSGIRLPAFPKEDVFTGAQVRMSPNLRRRSIGPVYDEKDALRTSLLEPQRPGMLNGPTPEGLFSVDSPAGHLGPGASPRNAFFSFFGGKPTSPAMRPDTVPEHESDV